MLEDRKDHLHNLGSRSQIDRPVPSLIHYARLAATPIEYLIRLDRSVRQSTTWSSGSEYQAMSRLVYVLRIARRYMRRLNQDREPG